MRKKLKEQFTSEVIYRHNSYRYTSPALRSVIVAAGMVIFFLIMLTSTLTANAQWDSNSFEDEIIMVIEPQTPLNQEPVNLTITSRDNELINAAHLYLEWTSTEGGTGSGGFEFKRLNDSAMSVQIPGYVGSTSVEYYVIAWDRNNNQIQSDSYAYTVISNGSWKYPQFQDNVLMDYSPKHPTSNDSVEVVLLSREFNVPISRANLHILVEFGNLPPQGGLIYFNKINATHYNATINPYPPGTKVTLWAEVSDQYFNKITSPKYFYSTPEPNPTSPDYNVSLFAVVEDARENRYAEGAQVTFANGSWSHTINTVNGIAWTPHGLPRGEYTITVAYEGVNSSLTASIPNEGNNYTYYFMMNKGVLGIEQPFINFPKVAPIVAMSILVILIPLFYTFAKRKWTQTSDPSPTSKEGKRTSGDEPGDKGQKKSLHHKVLNALAGDEEKKLTTAKVGAFFILGVAGASWAPFYPLWVILLIGIITAALAYRFTYLSLIMINIFVIAAASYQNTEFGWLYLLFATLILVIALFNWKFGYLVFLGIWLSKLGLAFVIPTMGIMFYSLMTGIAAGVFVYLYLMFFTGFLNMNSLAFFVAPEHDYALATFSRELPASLTPSTITHYLGQLSNVDLHEINIIFQANFTSMTPLLEMVLWIGALLLFGKLYQTFRNRSPLKNAGISSLAAFIPSLSFLVLMFHYGHPIEWEALVQAGLLPLALLGMVLFGYNMRSILPKFFSEKRDGETVGTSLSEVTNFRETEEKEVGGLENIKEEIKNSILIPLKRSDVALRYKVEPPHGILMFGPPGCGKTLIMRSVASKLKMNMFVVKCSDLMSKWYGESENAVNSLFQEAKSKRPCILFLDEIDAIAKSRDFYSTDDVTPRILSIMLSEMDGMDAFTNIIVVGATNKPNLIDSALLRPGRFDKIVFVPPPNTQAKREILKIHLSDKPVSKAVDLDYIAKHTKNFSGADIANLVKEAATLAMLRAIDSGKDTVIKNKDLMKILREIKPSISETMLKEYREMEELYQRKRYGKKVMKVDSSKFDEEPDIKGHLDEINGRYLEGDGEEYYYPEYLEMLEELMIDYECSNCGAPLDRDDIVCSQCGVWFKSPDRGIKKGRYGSDGANETDDEEDWSKK